ncbi:MAG: protein arginine kinase [Candidatus Omnitrophica bacterium]|nr:protein arginine kinase [Candidatus Omnitrophota bacterium]MBU2044278.1 protein arginine kinase [Candidatus Omnitrophota bacterium]MBU2251467.1 protein arginine kinase [Candidatus Omnitrophota bacterium]MBU2266286.1 protein arginine kinase [Candidatus Omnitrophota bacterium]
MFDNFISNKDSWLSQKGPESEIVFSSRIRLARNIADIPFPSRANPGQREKVFKAMQEVYPHIKRFKNSFFVNMGELTDLDSQFLLERHLISQEHLTKQSGRGIIVSPDEEISIMINEEDHLRMQAIASGFDLKKCWEVLDNIDNDISRKMSFSFSPDIGYLTACPTNVGTALRASCMLHLPALILTKRINKILELLARISFTTRGLFGEGTQALGDFFQISNQVSLGLSEEELIDNLISVVNQVKSHELDSRNTLVKKYKTNLEDNVWRALGILRNARLINSKEAFSHLSILSLGLDLGIIKEIDLSKGKAGQKLIRNLFIMIQPAHLQKIEGRVLREKERDNIRAAILRESLGG